MKKWIFFALLVCVIFYYVSRPSPKEACEQILVGDDKERALELLRKAGFHFPHSPAEAQAIGVIGFFGPMTGHCELSFNQGKIVARKYWLMD